VHIIRTIMYVHVFLCVSQSLSLSLCVCVSLSLSLALSLTLSLSASLSVRVYAYACVCLVSNIVYLFLIPRQRHKVALHKPSSLSSSLSAKGASADVGPDGGGSAAVKPRHEDG
jgi:hypothetical protein